MAIKNSQSQIFNKGKIILYFLAELCKYKYKLYLVAQINTFTCTCTKYLRFSFSYKYKYFYKYKFLFKYNYKYFNRYKYTHMQVPTCKRLIFGGYCYLKAKLVIA